MAIEILPREAKEGGTYVIQLRFKDEEGNFMGPVSLKWWLTDVNGNIINNRNEMSISEISEIVNITLQGNDLPPGWKVFTVEGTYDSNYGNDLPLKDSIKFYVRDLIEEN